MYPALWIAKTGLDAQQTRMSVISNNLANVNTTGFKRDRASFEDLIYQNVRQVGASSSEDTELPSGLNLGTGVRTVATQKLHTQGNLVQTNNSLDFAIEGRGFFQILTPDGSIQYTRDGTFSLDQDGQIVNSNGYPLEPAITVPTDATSISIEKDGGVNVTDPSGTQSVVGTLQLARFPNPSGLLSEGDNLLAETPASGTPTTGTAGEAGFGMIQSGFLEKSNVQMVTELVSLITAQRAYEINSRAIKVGDDMLRTANEIVR